MSLANAVDNHKVLKNHYFRDMSLTARTISLMTNMSFVAFVLLLCFSFEKIFRQLESYWGISDEYLAQFQSLRNRYLSISAASVVLISFLVYLQTHFALFM